MARAEDGVKIRWLAALLTVCIGGCAAEPFERPPLPILNDPNPAAMRTNFAHSLADKFTSDDTIVIDAPFHKMTILGVLEVDRKARTFELVGLNPMGVELFHLSGDVGGTKIQSALPPLMEEKEILLSIGKDIRRMYFDLVPGEQSGTDVGSTIVRFTEKTSDGSMVYEMGGVPTVLLEKRLAGCFGATWRVRYYQYTAEDGGLYPRGIVMDNAHYHYRIIVKNRDWQKN
jgi:Protein of unknown function (DUF3261)